MSEPIGQECQQCNGRGVREGHPCPACEGDGRVVVATFNIEGFKVGHAVPARFYPDRGKR